jgi:site-specific DNA-cytosine methylase
VIEWVQEFGGGFSCTQLSKANNRRKEHINCIADETGTTGGTWAGIRNYIIMARPSMSFLENVTELMNEREVPKPKGADEGDGSDDDNVNILMSTNKLIKQQLEEEGFTVILCVDQASDGGSRVERARCYPVVLDIPRDIAEELDVEGNFVRVMRQCRIPQFPLEMFMLSGRHLVELDEAMEGEPGPSAAKKSKAVAGRWPTTHEELYTLCGVEWPLDLANFQFAGLRPREQEVSFLAHKAFPPEGGGIGNSWMQTSRLSACSVGPRRTSRRTR